MIKMSKFPCLHLYVNQDNAELIHVYKEAVKKHNLHIASDPFPNAGFDLYIPDTIDIYYDPHCHGKLVDLQVKSEMRDNDQSLAYYLYPRSSLSKTPLMLSHSVGIIDCGYRGNIKASLRNLSGSASPYVVEKHSRLVQIVHPTMRPFMIELVKRETDLSCTTRGEGGFGSTGK